MDRKILFSWTEIINSPLIRTNKGKYVAFAGYNGKNGYVTCVYYTHVKGYEEIVCYSGPFNTLDQACSAAERYISAQIILPDSEVKV